MRVAIIGAGWFGCHIAMQLKARFVDVEIFEQSDDIFTGASRYNTGRLHQGFHYPRSGVTRRQCKEGFNEFIKIYKDICEPAGNNLYLVSDIGSYIDYETYLGILDQSGLEYEEVDPSKFGFQHVEGAVRCNELAINPNKARAYFFKHLEGNLRVSTRVDKIVVENERVKVNGEYFDFCVDCTYYSLQDAHYKKDVVYENVVTLLLKPLKKDTDISFVIMDGPFISLNKYYPKISESCYSLYHVNHSVVHESCEIQESYNFYQKAANNPAFHADSKLILNDTRYYYPNFDHEFELTGSFLSIRTKLVNANASRECMVEQNGRMVHVFSGKINSVFEASDKVASMLSLT